jgi:hypothetical protein
MRFIVNDFLPAKCRMKICPTTFGPYFWSVIHMTALSASENITAEKRDAYVRFFESMPDVLPCAMCGKHLKENLQVLPVDTDDMFKWSVDLHNLVNSQLNKPEVPYDKAYNYWSARCARGADKDRTTLVVCLVVAVILVLLFFVTRK